MTTANSGIESVVLRTSQDRVIFPSAADLAARSDRLYWMIPHAGRIELDPAQLHFSGSDSYQSPHKYFLTSRGDHVYMYCGVAQTHMDLGLGYGSRGNAGGGSVYLNNANVLILDDWTGGKGGSVPPEVALVFGHLLLPELDSLGIRVEAIVAKPYPLFVAKYWQDHGLRSNVA